MTTIQTGKQKYLSAFLSILVLGGLTLAVTIPTGVYASSHLTAPGSGPNGNVTAPGTGSCPSGKLCNPLEADTISELFKQILEIVLVFAVPIVVFFIILAGFKYVTAQGNPEKIKTATNMLLWAVVGGILILGAWILVEVIQGTVDALK